MLKNEIKVLYSKKSAYTKKKINKKQQVFIKLYTFYYTYIKIIISYFNIYEKCLNIANNL